MKAFRLVTVCSVSLCLACNDAPDIQARGDLASLLRDSVGQAADPQVAFLNNNNHLLVHLDAKPFTHLSDSAFSAEARRIAQVAMRNYQGKARIDSISVEAREIMVPNQAMRVRESRTFSVAELGRNGEY
jgi:hypothetical protein